MLNLQALFSYDLAVLLTPVHLNFSDALDI